jgi:hypothetical protein
MAEINAFPTEGVEAVTVSDDGTQAVFTFKVAGGASQAIAVPSNALMALLELTSIAAGQSAKILRADPSAKHIFPMDWWTIGRNPADGQIVMSFRLPGGMELSFQMHPDAAIHFQEVLSATVLGAPNPEPGTPRH